MSKYLLVFLCFSTTAFGQWRLLEPREVYIDVYENSVVNDPYLAPVDSKLTNGASFVTNFSILEYGKTQLYSENTLHFDQTISGKVKHAGWMYGLYLRPWSWNHSAVELFQQHHSRHLFDESRPVHFPNYTRYGIRLTIFSRGIP